MVLCFLQCAVQVQCSLKAAKKGKTCWQICKCTNSFSWFLCLGLQTNLLVNWMSCTSSWQRSKDSLFSNRMAAQMKSSNVKSVLMTCRADFELYSANTTRQKHITILIFNWKLFLFCASFWVSHLCCIFVPAFPDTWLGLLAGKWAPGGHSSGSQTNAAHPCVQTPSGNPAAATLRRQQQMCEFKQNIYVHPSSGTENVGEWYQRSTCGRRWNFPCCLWPSEHRAVGPTPSIELPPTLKDIKHTSLIRFYLTFCFCLNDVPSTKPLKNAKKGFITMFSDFSMNNSVECTALEVRKTCAWTVLKIDFQLPSFTTRGRECFLQKGTYFIALHILRP